MIRMKKVSVVCILLFLMLQFGKIAILQYFERAYQEGRVEIYPREELNYESFSLAYEGQGEKDEEVRCYIGQQYEQVGNNKEIKVSVLGITHTYTAFEKVNLYSGSFWGQQAQLEGRNVVVISKKLAGKLFNTYEVLGEIIKLGENSYQIIGVYEENNDLFSTLVDCREEEIYIPLTSQMGSQMKVESIWCMSEEDAMQFAGYFVQETSMTYKRTDARKRLEAIKDLGINLLVWTIMICLVKESIDRVFFEDTWMKRLGSTYSIKGQHIEQKKKMGYVACYLIGLVILGKGLVRSIYISPEALPPYNIFDISHYWDYFKGQIAIHQKMGRVSLTSFEAIYWMLSKWSIYLTVVQLGVCFPIATNVIRRFNNTIEYIFRTREKEEACLLR